MDGRSSALLTDLYQLTMAHGYFGLGMRETAVFELFSRRLPDSRRFLIAGGLAHVIEYLENLRFTAADLEFLASMEIFPRDFLDYLGTVRFSGSLHAMPEGTPFFANEPILRVTAPILEAQLVESRLMNLAHFQTLIASKAARCVLAAGGRRLVDFGMRRAHGAEAAVLAARAAYLAGFDATATVEAGRAFGIPLSGTMAHSFIEAHDDETEALRNFVTVRGRRTAVLIDTYDTLRAAERVARLARELRAAGSEGAIEGVRIDSGDLAAEARAVRRILDEHGSSDVEIILSGSLDEQEIARLIASGAPVDSFGIGTRLDVSADAPALDLAYKLEDYAGLPRRKRSPGKQTWPGAKQVFRTCDERGQMRGDLVALASETMPGEPLLQEVMRDGRRMVPAPPLSEVRKYCHGQIQQLPDVLRSIEPGSGGYDLRISARLQAIAAEFDARDGAMPGGGS